MIEEISSKMFYLIILFTFSAKSTNCIPCIKTMFNRKSRFTVSHVSHAANTFLKSSRRM